MTISANLTAPEARYRRYMLIVLMTIYGFNGMDALALGLVAQDIKRDLGLSDTELGTLSGIAFALFYSLLGLPIARWADRGNRVAIISLALTVWSALLVLCGLAATYGQLLVIRMGVAVGESGCNPPAQSLIGDYFDRSERPRAIATYMLGAAGSIIVGYFVAGWVNQFYGWRATFMMLGVPGPAIAAVAWLTLKEPRSAQPKMSASVRPDHSLRRIWRELYGIGSFRNLLISFAVASFFANGIVTWQGAFFIRSFGFKTGELGTWFAVIYGVGGMAGLYVGGHLASTYARDRETLQLRAMGIAYVSFAVISTVAYLSRDPYLSLILIGIAAFGGSLVCAPLFAVLQSLVPEDMRATAIAIVYLFSNLIGTGLGPLASGILSDTLRPWVGDESLRYALLALSPGYLWAGWHLWRASNTVAADLARLPRAEQIELQIGNAENVAC
jgi:MFS family permease